MTEQSNRGGRPPIGPRIMIAFPQPTLDRAEEYGKTTNEHKPEKCSRNDAIRALVDIGLAVTLDKHPPDVAEWQAHGGLSDIDGTDVEPE